LENIKTPHLQTEYITFFIGNIGILYASFFVKKWAVGVLYIPQKHVFENQNNSTYNNRYNIFKILFFMAKSKGNVITYGLSGKVGDLLIFRRRNGETIVAKLPEYNDNPSEEQKETRRRFKRATTYAKTALNDPQIREQYESAANKKKGITAYNVAIADFFNKPEIEEINLEGYSGVAGDEIRIIASDDFTVKSVHVEISNADGETVEKGYAVNTTGNLWIYVATQNNCDIEENKFVVSVSDMPGNITVEEVSL
jgi:hypothetical protein